MTLALNGYQAADRVRADEHRADSGVPAAAAAPNPVYVSCSRLCTTPPAKKRGQEEEARRRPPARRRRRRRRPRRPRRRPASAGTRAGGIRDQLSLAVAIAAFGKGGLRIAATRTAGATLIVHAGALDALADIRRNSHI